MTNQIIFIQIHGRPGILEAELAEATTIGHLHKTLAAAGIETDAGTFIFIDESEEHLHGEHGQPVPHLKHGSRVHVSRCKRIKTTVHFLNRTVEREFAPGIRVRAAKAWAVHEFKMSPNDAAEHVLQICNTTTRPAPDTPLHELADKHACALCFDLVPEKRVEG